MSCAFSGCLSVGYNAIFLEWTSLSSLLLVLLCYNTYCLCNTNSNINGFSWYSKTITKACPELSVRVHISNELSLLVHSCSKSDKVVRREICSIQTKGTKRYSFIDGDAGSSTNNFLLAVCEKVIYSLLSALQILLPILSFLKHFVLAAFCFFGL